MDHSTHSANLRHVRVAAINHSVAKPNENLSASRIWTTASKRHTTTGEQFWTTGYIWIVLDWTLPAISFPLVQQISVCSNSKLDYKIRHIAIKSRVIEVSIFNELQYA